ncbi:MAG: DUF6057 family protein [Planctomycetota bacterium]
MRSLEQKISWRNWSFPAGSIIFFVCFYLYVWLFIEPRLIYHGFVTFFMAYPAFSVDLEFLTNSLSYPGGMVEYAGGLLSQLYYFSWLGALIVTVVAWLMYIATRILIRLSAPAPAKPQVRTEQILKLICYIPAVMLLMMHNRYDIQLTAFIALLAALWFSVAYESLSLRSSISRAAVFLVMLVLLYYIAAGGVSFVFALLAIIYELFVGRRRGLSLLFLTIAIGAYVVLRYIFNLEAEMIYLPLLKAPLGYDTQLIVICVYFFFPLVLFVAGLRQVREWTSVDMPKMHAEGKSSVAKKTQWFLRSGKGKWAIEMWRPIILVIVIIFVSFNGTRKKLIQVDYFAHHRMWPEVLETAGRIRPESYDASCIHDIDRALYYSGRLGDEMFCYPQKLPALLLNIDAKVTAMICMKRSQLFLELGYTGGAENDAFSFMEIKGNSPLILEQLAKIKLVKGQIKAAKVFLRALSKDLIFGHRGREMLRRLEEDPEMASDKTIQHIRSVACEKDITSKADDLFRQLLDKNKNNKMAFEYMMAFYLLTGQTGKIVENIGYLNEMGYKRLPRYYEEAIAMYTTGSGGKNIELHGWQLRPETIMQCMEFGRIFNQSGGSHDKESARNALVSNFGKSYFFYFGFGLPKAIK